MPTFPSAPPVSGYHTTPPTGYHTTPPTAPPAYSSTAGVAGIRPVGLQATLHGTPAPGVGPHGLPTPRLGCGTPAPILTAPLGPAEHGVPPSVLNQIEYPPIIATPEELKAADKLRNLTGEYRHNNNPTWTGFIDRFYSGLRSCAIGMEQAKQILYMSLRDDAFDLASPFMNPTRFPGDTTYQYVARLQELFQPGSESGQIKMAFEARTQRPGEHALTYYQHKVGLFLQAYPEGTQDFDMLYTKVISGLVNTEMRKYLRTRYPEPRAAVHKFRAEIAAASTMVRRMLMDGEISDREATGAEMYDSIPDSGKQNPSNRNKIHQLGGDATAPKGVCFYCGQPGHFVAQCDRKAAGLPAAAQTQAAKVGVVKNQQANGGRGRGGRSRGSFKGRGRGKGRSGPGKFHQYRRRDGRISFLQEDEDGVMHEVVVDAEPAAPASGEVHQVGEEIAAFAEEHANGGPFLGATH